MKLNHFQKCAVSSRSPAGEEWLLLHGHVYPVMAVTLWCLVLGPSPTHTHTHTHTVWLEHQQCHTLTPLQQLRHKTLSLPPRPCQHRAQRGPIHTQTCSHIILSTHTHTHTNSFFLACPLIQYFSKQDEIKCHQWKKSFEPQAVWDLNNNNDNIIYIAPLKTEFTECSTRESRQNIQKY